MQYIISEKQKENNIENIENTIENLENIDIPEQKVSSLPQNEFKIIKKRGRPRKNIENIENDIKISKPLGRKIRTTDVYEIEMYGQTKHYKTLKELSNDLKIPISCCHKLIHNEYKTKKYDYIKIKKQMV